MASLTRSDLETPHGTLAIFHTPGPSSPSTPENPALLLLHGNSTSSQVFLSILTSPLLKTHRLIAFDLPGHGLSSNAPDPEASYTQSSYANAALLVLSHLNVRTALVLGWSLGGHVALEMLPRCDKVGISIRSVMLVGTPPIPRGDPAAGFYTASDEMAAFRAELSDAELEDFSRHTTGPPFEGWMRENVFRTHGLARSVMYAAMRDGKDSDQRGIAEGTKGVVLAVVNGAEEPYIRLEYVRGVKYGNLWRGKCFEVPGLGHCPFWEDFGAFWELLEGWVGDCSKEEE